LSNRFTVIASEAKQSSRHLMRRLAPCARREEFLSQFCKAAIPRQRWIASLRSQ
jgi:hypothetical protein